MRRLFVLSFLLAVGCRPVQDQAPLALGDVQLSDLAGNVVEVSQFEGKAVVINVWATWCKPCLQEMPSLAVLQDQLKAEPIVFLFASDETPERIARFREKQGFDFNYVQLDNLESLNVQALPTTFIFDKAGALQFTETGFRDWTSPESRQMIKNVITPL